LENQTRDADTLAQVARGGYILKDSDGAPEYILIATGSEVGLAVDAASELGTSVRVVSMPSTTRFDAQDPSYREMVLPASCTKRVAIEAGHPDIWFKYVGLAGDVIGINRFGESGAGPEVMAHFGFTAEHVIERVRAL
jgi:transketolase